MKYFCLLRTLSFLVSLLCVAGITCQHIHKCDLFDGHWGKRLDKPSEFNITWCLNHFRRGIFRLGGIMKRECPYPLNYYLETLKYEWIPANCPRLIEYNPDKINRYFSEKATYDKNVVTRGRKMFFIGDSLTIQAYETLTCFMSNYVDIQRSIEKTDEGNIKVLLGGGELEMLASDNLLNSTLGLPFTYEVLETPNQRRTQSPWARVIKEESLEGDIIFLNTGPHFKPDELEFYRHAITETFLFLKSEFRGSHIFFRDNYQGVHPCHENMTITNSSTDSPPWLISNFWNYKDMPYYNGFAREIAKKIDLNVTFLKVSKLTSLRCDRIEYLHFCVPGPQYEWIRIVLQYLLGNEKIE